MWPLVISNYIELIALAIGIYTWRKIKQTPLSLLVILLIIINIAELSGRYISKEYKTPNVHIFNVSTIIEFEFYAILFIAVFRNKVLKKINAVFIIAFPIVCVLNFVFLQSFMKQFHTYSMALGAAFTILNCCLYFKQVLNYEEELALSKLPMFWIATGLLFFYSGSIINDTLVNYTFLIKFENKYILYQIVNNCLIVILYSSFIVSFLCYKTQKNWY